MKSVNIVFKKCLALKKNEKVLIITDSKLYDISKLFYNVAKKTTKTIKIIKIPIPKVSGTEPSKEVAKEMLNYDIELLITTKSLSHTKARKNACKNGARIASMPGITKDMIKRTIDINYNQLIKNNKKIADILDKGKKIRLKTKLGTDLEFSINGRKAYGRESGIYDKKGKWGNLPEGEIFIAPVEGTANGVYVVDASFASIGKLKNPIKLFVKNGYAIKIIGKNAKKLENLLNSVGKEARNMAEFGIGTNEKAKVTGKVLEDEKVKGTCHIALGNNDGFGGKVNVQLHLDGVIRKPTIFVDDKKIMENGKFLI